MLSLKKSFTEQPARPEEAHAQAHAQLEAHAQLDAQDEAQEDAQEERGLEPLERLERLGPPPDRLWPPEW
jgi:hypothetical protein